MRLPELRHNLRLINDACKSDLDGLAREAKALEDRKKRIREEDQRLRKRVEDEAQCEFPQSCESNALIAPIFRSNLSVPANPPRGG